MRGKFFSLSAPPSRLDRESRPNLGVPSLIAANIVLAIVYYYSGLFGLSLATVNRSATAVWPPAGIAVAVLLLGGKGLWPGIFVGAYCVNMKTQGTLLTSLGIATGNTLEAWIGAFMVNRFAGGTRAFEHTRNVFRFGIFAAIFSTLFSPTIGIISLSLGHFVTPGSYSAAWITWWLGDVVSVLVVAPLLIVWSRQGFPRISVSGIIETAALLVLMLEFAMLPFQMGSTVPFRFLAIPLILWAAFRLGQRGATAFIFFMACTSVAGVLWGGFSSITGSPAGDLQILQTFMAVSAMMALVIAAVVAERTRAERRLLVQEAVSRSLAESITLQEASGKILKALCKAGDWDLGAVWHVEKGANRLVCVEFLSIPPEGSRQFEAITRQTKFAPGVGLPGRVWASGQPVWITDVAQDGNFPRAEFAKHDNLHSAFCFPLVAGREVLGVLECLSRQYRTSDRGFLEILELMGLQFGQFMERKRIEEERSRVEALRGAMLDSALDCIISIDRESRVIEFNHSAETTFGYSRADAIGKRLTDLIIPPRLHQDHFSGIAHYFVSGDGPLLGRRIEMPAVCSDGSEITVEMSINAIASEGQTVFTAFLRDISELHEARKSQEMLAAIVKSSSDAIFSKTLEGIVTTWNEAAEHIYGYRAKEVIGTSIRLIIPPELAGEELKIIAEIRAGHRLEYYETIRLRKDGIRVNISLSASPILDEQGEIIGASIVARDITERKNASETMRLLQIRDQERVAEIEALMDATPAIVWIAHDPECNVITGNKLSYEFLHMEHGSNISRTGAAMDKRPPYKIYKNHQELASAEMPMQRAARTGLGIWHEELDVVLEDGTVRQILMSAVPLVDASNVARGALATAMDITERKLAEIALEEAKDQLADHAQKLEETVARRTERLRESVAELESFSYSLSHDMRAPLRAIQSFTQILLKDSAEKIGQPGIDYLERMASAAARLDRLIQDVLTYNRMSRGKLIAERVDVEKLIRTLIAERPEWQPPHAEIKIVAPLLPMMGHEASMMQCISNLLDNALKFVDPDIQPLVCVHSENVNGSGVRLWFDDNGIGIEREAQARVFDLFHRSDSGSRYQGTGLGLAIVRKACERQDGRVGFESEPGKGSRFWIEMPGASQK